MPEEVKEEEKVDSPEPETSEEVKEEVKEEKPKGLIGKMADAYDVDRIISNDRSNACK